MLFQRKNGLPQSKVMSVSRIKRRFEEFINLVMQQGGDLDLEFFTFSSFTIFIREPGIDKSTKQSYAKLISIHWLHSSRDYDLV